MLMSKISTMLLWSLCKNEKDEGSVADSLKKSRELAVNITVTVGASMMFGIGFSLHDSNDVNDTNDVNDVNDNTVPDQVSVIGGKLRSSQLNQPSRLSSF